MHKIEEIITVGIIAMFIITLILGGIILIFRFIAETFALAFNRCIDVMAGVFATIGSFFALVPAPVYAAAMIVLMVIALVYIGLRAYHSIVRSRNEASIVEIHGRRVMLCNGGVYTAISYGGENVTVQPVGSAPAITMNEKRILEHMEKKMIEYQRGNYITDRKGNKYSL